MDELVNVMEEILIELKEMNSKLDDIQGSGIYKSIADVCDKVDDVCDTIDSLETTITLGDNY